MSGQQMRESESRRSRRRRGRWLAVVTIAAIVGLQSQLAQATHVSPSLETGNPTCGTFNSAWTEYKVEGGGLGNGTVGDGTLSVTISGFNSPEGTFDWSSNIGVDAVFVKGGPNGNLYQYSPEATSDTNLVTPTNPSNGRPYGISHISFCYDVETPTTTPPTTPPETTPPTTPPETTPPTTPPETTPPTETPTDTVSPTETISPTVLPTKVTPPGDELAFTGLGTAGMGALTLALMTLGSGLLWVGSRRPRRR